MNYLDEKILKKFEVNDECTIERNKDKFKVNIIFEDKEENIMKIKLYKFKNGLILKFFRKKGDKKYFFDKFRVICDLVNNIFEI